MVGRAATILWFVETIVRNEMREQMWSMTHRRIGDFAVLLGNIEVDADKDTFTAEIEICNCKFVGKRHDVGCDVDLRRAIELAQSGTIVGGRYVDALC
jgi:hypothetical protein